MRSYSTFVLSLLQKTTTIVGVLLLCNFVFSHDAFAATFSFAPASGSYTVGSTISVGVYAGSSDKALNAASGIVSFPENLLEVVSISKNQSVISLWVQEPSFSNAAGTINYEGIVLNPGYTGASGKVITVNFKVKAQGTALLSFSGGSILANDGSGTEILTAKGTASFTLTPKVNVDLAPPLEAEEQQLEEQLHTVSPVTPKIESASHTLNGWSNSATGTFNFVQDEGIIAMRLLLDTNPESVPTVVYEPPIKLREITGIEEGVSYLHVQYKNKEGWGTISHYKLQVDTQSPTDFTVVKNATGTEASETVAFTFTAKDSLSSIDRYEVQIDGGAVERFVGGEVYTYTTPKGLVAGVHTMKVSAIDKAGNAVSTKVEFVTTGGSKNVAAEEDIHVSKSEAFIERAESLITLLSVVVPIVALVLLLSWLAFTAWHAYGGLKKKIAKDVLEAKMLVHRAFALLRDDLQTDIETLKKASTKRKLTREEAKILKRLQKNIDEAEKVIAKEVEDVAKEV